MCGRLVEIMSLREREVQRWFDVERNLHCTNSAENSSTQQKAFVEYSHWQKSHLENTAEQNFPAKCLLGFKKLHVVFLSGINSTQSAFPLLQRCWSMTQYNQFFRFSHLT